METDVLTPTFDPQTIREIIFSYWGRDDDIACIHINERRSAFTIEVDGGIYLREDGGNVVGIEVHAFSRAFAGSRALSRVTIPALMELKAFAGRTLDESFDVRGHGGGTPEDDADADLRHRACPCHTRGRTPRRARGCRAHARRRLVAPAPQPTSNNARARSANCGPVIGQRTRSSNSSGERRVVLRSERYGLAPVAGSRRDIGLDD